MDPLNNAGEYGWNDSQSFQHMHPPGSHTQPALGPTRLTNPFAIDHQSAEPSGDMQVDEPNPRILNVASSMNAPNRTGSRRSRYKGLDWDAHKSRIKQLYLDDDKSLLETMRIMKESHSFEASKKLYKEKFRDWHWQKNLPSDYAQFMVTKANKRKREEDKETTFIYGGLRWTKQRAEASASRTKKDVRAQAIHVETPSEITYETPDTHRGALLGLSPKDRPGSSMEGVLTQHTRNQAEHQSESESESEDEEDDNAVEAQAFHLSWKGQTRTDFIAMLEAAKSNKQRGDHDAAEEMFKKVLEGYEQILSPIHEDTNKVAYALATFYAEQARMAEANKILEDMSRKHVDQCGPEDQRTQKHVLHVIELLHAWNRPNDALAFLTRAKYLVEMEPNDHKKRKTSGRDRTPQPGKKTPNTRTRDIRDIRLDIIKDADPATIKHGLGVARAYVTAKDGAVEALLLAIIEHCQHDPNGLMFEALEARNELLRLYSLLDVTDQHLAVFNDTWRAVNHEWHKTRWDPESFKSLEILELFMKLACSFLKGQLDQEARTLFRRIEDQASNLFGSDDERTIWILISVGLVYQSNRDWDQAQPWFEQALAFSYATYHAKDGITISLETAMRNHHFSYITDEGRPFKTIFGVGGIVIRPGRLHIE